MFFFCKQKQTAETNNKKVLTFHRNRNPYYTKTQYTHTHSHKPFWKIYKNITKFSSPPYNPYHIIYPRNTIYIHIHIYIYTHKVYDTTPVYITTDNNPFFFLFFTNNWRRNKGVFFILHDSVLLHWYIWSQSNLYSLNHTNVQIKCPFQHI